MCFQRVPLMMVEVEECPLKATVAIAPGPIQSDWCKALSEESNVCITEMCPPQILTS